MPSPWFDAITPFDTWSHPSGLIKPQRTYRIPLWIKTLVRQVYAVEHTAEITNALTEAVILKRLPHPNILEHVETIYGRSQLVIITRWTQSQYVISSGFVLISFSEGALLNTAPGTRLLPP